MRAFHVDFYILRGRRGNLVIVQVMLRLLHIFLIVFICFVTMILLFW